MRPVIAPARTSPVPPEARPGLAKGLSRARPSAAATTVFAPLRTAVRPQSDAQWRATARRSAWVFLDGGGTGGGRSPGGGGVAGWAVSHFHPILNFARLFKASGSRGM